MEPNDILIWLVVFLAAIAVASVLLVAYGLVRNAQQRSRAATPQPGKPAAQPKAPRLSRPRQPPPPPPLPELIAEATETPPDKRMIEATADTLQALPEDVRAAAWAAAVPRLFNADVLSALRPEWKHRAVDLYDAVQRLWFVDAAPGGSCVQPVVRRAMLRHLSRKEDHREVYLQDSVRAAKYFHAYLVKSAGSDERNTRFVSDTFFRFLPPECGAPAATIEWLYHLAVVDAPNAAQALQQLGEAWLIVDRRADLLNLLAGLREHADENRLSPTLYALVYFYLGQAARRTNDIRGALAALERARQQAQHDPAVRERVLNATSEALDVINSPGANMPPDASVWSSLARPPDDRVQRSLWSDLQLPRPVGDELRRVQEAYRVARAVGNRAAEALALRAMGDEHRAHANYRVALDWYRRALALWEELIQQQPRDERQYAFDRALTLKSLGDVRYLMGRSDEAVPAYHQALDLLARLTETHLPEVRLAEADVYRARGDVLHFLWRYTEALPDYQRALSGYHRAGALVSEAETTLALGRLRQGLGDLAEAQHCFDDALKLYQLRGSSIGQANALLVIGTSLAAQGQLPLAAQRLDEARFIYRAEKNEPGEAAALKAWGDVLLKLKQFDVAQERYEEALTQFRAGGLLRNTAETQLAIGRLCCQRQDYQAAHDHYQLALLQFNNIEDRQGEADVRLALGELHQVQRQDEQAKQLYLEALDIYRQVRDRSGEAQATRWLGEACLLSKDYIGALVDFQAALNLWVELGDPQGASEELHGRIGHTLALLDRRVEAQRAFETAAEKHSSVEFGWLGWRAVVAAQFADAAVHFAALMNRDQAVNWQVGLALAQYACGKHMEAEASMEAALRRANTEELGEACRWIEVVARIAPDLDLKADQFGLMC
jgi:tetratricopeptide (TPR) repeat protein